MIVLLVCILFSCSSQEKIIFAHIGISDKPILTIEILYEQKDTSDIYKKTFIIDKKQFCLLKSYMKNNGNHISIIKPMEYSYGSFKVILQENSKKHEWIIINREDSIVFFNNLLPLLHSNIKLYNEIEVLLKRLRLAQNDIKIEK